MRPEIRKIFEESQVVEGPVLDIIIGELLSKTVSPDPKIYSPQDEVLNFISGYKTYIVVFGLSAVYLLGSTVISYLDK